MFKILSSILLLLFCLDVRIAYPATVYKCAGEGEGGSTLFSETPCKTQKGQKLYYQDNYPMGEGLSILEIEALKEIEQREKQMEEQQKLETNLDGQQDNQTKKTLVEAHDKQKCETAEKAVKEWQKIMSLGYTDEAGDYFLEEMQKRNATRYKACGNR